MNLKFYYDKEDDFCFIKNTSNPEEEFLKVFLLSINDKVVLKVLRKLINKEKGSYFLGEFLTFEVKKDKCTITDDWNLDLGVEEVEIKSGEILELLDSWEKFLVKHNKLQEN